MQKYYCKHGKKNASGCQCHCDCTLTWSGGEKHGWRETPLLMPLLKIRREAPCSRSKIPGAWLRSPPGVELNTSLCTTINRGPVYHNLQLPMCGRVFQTNGIKDPKEVTCIPLNILFDPEAALTRLRLAEEQSLASETKMRLNQLRGRLIPNTAWLQHPITSNILTGLLLQGISFNFERYRNM